MNVIGTLFNKIRLLFHNNENENETVGDLKKEIKTMRNENESLTKEVAENKEKLRNFEMVSDALRAEPVENSFINEFNSLINNEYSKGLCNDVPGVNDAKNLKVMQQILEEMRLIANCPKLHSKDIGAVGGGFSSGKSSFINSFFTGSRVKLAEGIKPVTAIPSYVICDKDSAIHGISFRGGLFPITIDMYKEISHEFLKSFSFDLKEIITYTTVLTPMEDKYFKNLCLIDTPGYNPPGAGNTAHDFETARKYIEEAAFLIWIVGLDTNGTIPKSDIDFLSNMEFGTQQNKPLYIVANKAQLKTQGAIESILDKFEETLDDNDLRYEGISAYNSKEKDNEKRQLAHRKMDLFEFLEKHNKPSRKYVQLKEMLYDVFKDYFIEANRDFEERDNIRKKVKKLIWRALENGNISIDDNETSAELENGLNELVHYFQPKEQREELLKRIETLRDKFLECLDKFCDDVHIARIEEKFCPNCGEPINGKNSLCKKCSDALKNEPQTIEQIMSSYRNKSDEKICPQCGKELAAKAKFCSQCGADV